MIQGHQPFYLLTEPARRAFVGAPDRESFYALRYYPTVPEYVILPLCGKQYLETASDCIQR